MGNISAPNKIHKIKHTIARQKLDRRACHLAPCVHYRVELRGRRAASTTKRCSSSLCDHLKPRLSLERSSASFFPHAEHLSDEGLEQKSVSYGGMVQEFITPGMHSWLHWCFGLKRPIRVSGPSPVESGSYRPGISGRPDSGPRVRLERERVPLDESHERQRRLPHHGRLREIARSLCS